MKTNLLPGLLLILATATLLPGASLTQDADVRLRPDSASPVIARLQAGFEPKSASIPAPAGWTAVEIPGPFEVFVANGEIDKEMNVKEGATFLLEPRAGATALTQMTKGDTADVTGLRGRYTEVRLGKSVIGYIQAGTAPAPASPAPTPLPAPGLGQTSPPAPIVASTPSPAPALSPAPSGPVAVGANAAGLPRTMRGHFTSSQRPLAPRRPFDFQLEDDAGIRIAYLDLSQARLPDRPERLVNRVVTVTGIAENSAEARALVIRVSDLSIQ